MEAAGQEDILADADEARVNSLKSTYSEVKYKLTLLPMYLSSFTYKKKAYHVLVNGENGTLRRRGSGEPVARGAGGAGGHPRVRGTVLRAGIIAEKRKGAGGTFSVSAFCHALTRRRKSF